MSKWGIEEKETLEAINKIGFKGNILDVAAGDGRFINSLLESSDTVTAIDIDENELNNFSLDIQASTFKEEDLDDIEYKSIRGNFLIVSGVKQ